jgi:hypothetical protein
MFRRLILAALAATAFAAPAFAWPAHLAMSGGGGPAPTTIYANGTLALTSGAATITASGGCASGKTAIAMLGNGVGRSSSSITDSKGNTWIWVRDNFFGAGGNLYGSIWKSTLTSSLVGATDTLTITYDAAVTQGFVIFDCIGTATVDATGGGSVGGSSTAPNTIDVSTSASPPTNAARVFVFLADLGDYSGVMVSDPSGPGWTLADSALDTSDYGFKLYYQNVSAGATSILRWTHSGVTVNWGALWSSFD